MLLSNYKDSQSSSIGQWCYYTFFYLYGSLKDVDVIYTAFYCTQDRRSCNDFINVHVWRLMVISIRKKIFYTLDTWLHLEMGSLEMGNLTHTDTKLNDDFTQTECFVFWKKAGVPQEEHAKYTKYSFNDITSNTDCKRISVCKACWCFFLSNVENNFFHDNMSISSC